MVIDVPRSKRYYQLIEKGDHDPVEYYLSQRFSLIQTVIMDRVEHIRGEHPPKPTAEELAIQEKMRKADRAAELNRLKEESPVEYQFALEQDAEREKREREEAAQQEKNAAQFTKPDYDFTHMVNTTRWKETVPKMLELNELMEKHTQLLIRGDSAIFEHHSKKREADNQAEKIAAAKEDREPELRHALREALSRGENDKERAYFFEIDVNDRMAYSRNHLRAEMFDRFVQHLGDINDLKVSDKKSYADLHGPNYGGKEIDFSTTHLLRKDNGEKISEGVYLNAYSKALEEMTAIEKSRGEFIGKVKKSRAYTELPDQKAKDGHMGLRLMEVYRIDTDRFAESLGVNRYFPPLGEMQSLVEKEKARNAKEAAPPRKNPIQAPAPDKRAGLEPGDDAIAAIGKTLQSAGFTLTSSDAAIGAPNAPQVPGELKR